MSDKLPIEVRKDNIFTKISNFLKNIFKKKPEDIVIEENKDAVKVYQIIEENNLKEFQNAYNSRRNPQKVIEEIIQIIEKNPCALENLDIPKLEIIDMYYKQKIMECKRKLKKSSTE